jgi:hypothetical protein
MLSPIRCVLITIACVLIASVMAGETPQTLRGTVYLDANRNDMRDAGERGVANVAVSNGSDVVRTDAEGRYALPIADGQSVFVIKPASYALPNGPNGLPMFWRNLETKGSPPLKYGGIKPTGPLPKQIDFALLPEAKRDPQALLDVLVFGDPQPKNLLDVDYYRRAIVDPIRAQSAKGGAAQFGISLGDIVSDDLSLYPAIDHVTASLHVPWLHVAGNHDQDEDAPDDAHATDTFRANYGPTTAAWEEMQAEFISLDDVVFDPRSKLGYVGGLREDQFAFLQSYLPTLPKDRLLVIGVHIPFFDTAAPGVPETFRRADRERLFALLKDFPHVLLLSAHTHNQRMVLHDDASDGWQGAAPLREYNVGTACGAFWSGVKDAKGIPISTMSDGTPNGWATLQVSANGEYRLAWHVAQLPANDPSFNDAMALEAPKVLRHGAYPAWAVYANVFMGDANTMVEYRIDDGAWKPMTRVLKPDPRLMLENAADDTADRLRGYDRSAEAAVSTHLWRGVLATDLAAGMHRVEVREFDPWLGERHALTSYRLDDASP